MFIHEHRHAGTQSNMYVYICRSTCISTVDYIHQAYVVEGTQQKTYIHLHVTI